MVEKVSGRIKTLSGFLRWAEQFKDGQYLFRGVSKDIDPIEASAYRRLPETDRNNSVNTSQNQSRVDKQSTSFGPRLLPWKPLSIRFGIARGTSTTLVPLPAS